ncbi:hypothetical protein D6850_09980 [Roseovarius spongiae]|uniref:Uncharacterized protein n=1 Tax=Roseovarius spongiae TaxID=2320272 RepID=A0A3A8B3F3_9RHOB|nr:hypothetical protein [Roseovarius spongiae]RKF15162.1 hypothetical protein D6850_09980 [Roseovarius spongiae]
MYGVVLWSDQNPDRAVIWCEDHGDLAFYRCEGRECPEMAQISPGDLVTFDLCEKSDMRRARAPRLVEQDSHPNLTRALQQAGRNAGAFPDTQSDVPAPGAGPQQPETAQNVVPFRRPAMAG